MKQCVCIFLALVVCCLSDIITEYKYLQQDSDVTDLDILHCQLRANGNNSCAFRFDTTTTNGVWEERERCEELGVDWCTSGTLDAGYAYVGKAAVSRTPPFSFNYYVSGGDMLWELSDDIPIAIKTGAQLTIQFTAPVAVWSRHDASKMEVKIRSKMKNPTYACLNRRFYHLRWCDHSSVTKSNEIMFNINTNGVSGWSIASLTKTKIMPDSYFSIFTTKIEMNFKTDVGNSVYQKVFLPGGLISSGVESTVTAEFDPSEIRLYVQGTLEPSGNIGSVTDIRVFQFLFVDNPGDIHRVSYKAAP